MERDAALGVESGDIGELHGAHAPPQTATAADFWHTACGECTGIDEEARNEGRRGVTHRPQSAGREACHEPGAPSAGGTAHRRGRARGQRARALWGVPNVIKFCSVLFKWKIEGFPDCVHQSKRKTTNSHHIHCGSNGHILRFHTPHPRRNKMRRRCFSPYHNSSQREREKCKI